MSKFIILVSRNVKEKFNNILVVHESFLGREAVVLECQKGRVCYLSSEVVRLVFPSPIGSLF